MLGIGVDLVDVDRFRKVLARRPLLAKRLFTEGEQAYAAKAADPAMRLAARFAAKEAVLKVLGTGIGGAPFSDIEVVRTTDGAPQLTLHREAARVAKEKGIDRWHLSLSHTTEHAIASAIAEGPASAIAEGPASAIAEAPASAIVEGPASAIAEAPASAVVEGIEGMRS